jgi:hypothetical protein
MATNNAVNKPVPTGDAVGTTDTQTLTNKDLTDSSNTFPGTTLNYAQITTAFSTATSGSPVDVTGLSITITSPSASRYIKIHGFCRDIYSNDTAGSSMTLSIAEGSTTLAEFLFTVPASNYGVGVNVFAKFIPTSGSHTYKLQIEQSGSGTVHVDAGATFPAFIDAVLQ